MPPPAGAPRLAAAVLSALPATAAASTTHAPSPAVAPSWTAASDEVLTTSALTTRWASHATARCAVATAARPRAPPVLARMRALAEAGGGGAVLVAVGVDFLYVAAAAGGLFECPLPTGLPRGAGFSRAFAAGSGLVVECDVGGGDVAYYSLMHPLEEMVRVGSFERGERVIFVGVDVGVALTSSGTEWTVWGLDQVPVVGIPDVAGNDGEDSDGSDSAGVGRSQNMLHDEKKAKDDLDEYRLNNVKDFPDLDEMRRSIFPPGEPFDDDKPLPSQRMCITSRKLYSAAIISDSAPRVGSASSFLAHSASGKLLLCHFASGRLTALDLEMDENARVIAASPTFNLDDVVSATSVMATRQAHAMLDIVVLHSTNVDSAVAVYAGDVPMCNLSIPHASARVVGFRDAVGCRVTAILDDGVALRLSLRCASSPSALVNRCLGVIARAFVGFDCTAPRYPALEIQRAMLARASANRGASRFLENPDQRDHDWLVFNDVLEAAVRPLSGRDSACITDGLSTNPSSAGITVGEYDDWLFLLGTEHHRTTGRAETLSWCSSSSRCIAAGSGFKPQLRDDTAGDNAGAQFSASAAVRIVEALHLLYEDMKLHVVARSSRHRLGSCLSQLASLLGAADLVDYHRRDCDDLRPLCAFSAQPANPTENSLKSGVVPFQGFARVPSIFDWLSRCLQFRQHGTDDVAAGHVKEGIFPDAFPSLSASTPNFVSQFGCYPASWLSISPVVRSEMVMRYYSILFGHASDSVEGCGPAALDSNARPQQVLRAMCLDGFGPRALDGLSFGVALPLREALWACRVSPGEGLPSTGDVLVGREDLWDVSRHESEGLRRSGADADATASFEYRSLLRTHAASALAEGVVGGSGIETGPTTSSEERHPGGSPTKGDPPQGDEDDGCEMNDRIFALRFASDRRISEVRRILRSTEPVVVHLATAAGEGGNGLPEGGQPNEQPWLLNRLTRLLKRHLAAPVGRGAFTLRTFTPTDPTKPLSIPSLCLKGKIAGQKGAKLTFNPETASYRTDWGEFHNGVAAGLRLVASSNEVGDGSKDGVSLLTRTWIVNHRPADTSGNASHAGMLLALGLGGYLPALRATDYYEYLVPMHDLTTIGLMLGVAAGNRGSLNAKITKMLCVHIRHFNGPGFAVPDFHVSLKVQAAAVLGMGLLYQGTCEHLIVEGLLVELSRRPQPGDDVQDRECLSLAAGFAIGFVCLGVGSSVASLRDLNLLDTLSLYAIGGIDPSVDAQHAGDEDPGASNGPASYFGINSKPAGGDTGVVPSTAADSEASRVRECAFVNIDVTGPGAILALALLYMKSNDIAVADRIVIPDTMYSLDRTRPDHVYIRCLARHLILWDSIVPSRAWVLSTLPELLRPPNTDVEDTVGFDMSRLREYENIESDGLAGPGHDIDEDGVLLARAFAITGACTAIALRYAGSTSKEALGTLVGVCVSLETILERQAEDNEEAEWVYATCLNSIGLAISIVAAGSGDLDMLRLLRRVRKRSGPSLRESRYGVHMANHMAVGFLFLGGGCLTFGTSKVAVAALLCAIHPRFPNGVEDNQYHLQAMRHLYVLAVEPRCIEARDVDTDLPCSVAVAVGLKVGTQSGCERLTMTAPCLLPDARIVESISVVSERYWPRVVSVKEPSVKAGDGEQGWFSSTKRQVLYVKRRAGHLPHDVDPTGSKGMLARSFSDSLVHLVKAFSADPKMRTFVTHFCELQPAPPAGTASTLAKSRSNADRYGEVLYECLSLDKPEAVECYLEIERAISALSASRACAATVGSLALLSEYAAVRRLWSCTPLVRRDYMWRSILQARDLLDTRAVRAKLARYITDGTLHAGEFDDWNDVGRALQLYRVPMLSALKKLRVDTVADEDDAWVTAGSALPADAPAIAVELIARVLCPVAETTS
jgi:hypothetical protein